MSIAQDAKLKAVIKEFLVNTAVDAIRVINHVLENWKENLTVAATYQMVAKDVIEPYLKQWITSSAQDLKLAIMAAEYATRAITRFIVRLVAHKIFHVNLGAAELAKVLYRQALYSIANYAYDSVVAGTVYGTAVIINK